MRRIAMMILVGVGAVLGSACGGSSDEGGEDTTVVVTPPAEGTEGGEMDEMPSPPPTGDYETETEVEHDVD